MNGTAPKLPSTDRGNLPPRLDTPAAVNLHLDALVALDPRLAPIRGKVGDVPPRHYPTGFAGLARVITGQQLSVVSAGAIWGRFAALPGALEAESYLRLSEEAVRGAGQSGGKYRTLGVIAEAVASGTLDFDHLDGLPADEAIAYLVAHKGIGPWTAEVYLLFAAKHPDVFPAGDLALLKAVQAGLALDARPTIPEMIVLARRWSPHRSSAALLFWRLFAVMREREGILL